MQALIHLFNDSPGRLRHKAMGIGLLLAIFNLGAWAWAFLAFHDRPLQLGTALIAYTFGLRHAVDADHIAAIDNVTRKLMQEGKRPVSVGFFFALGHSSVVLALTLGILGAEAALQSEFGSLRGMGQTIGTSVSAMFLFLIAGANIVILVSVLKAFQRVRRGEPFVEEELDLLLANRGFLARLFRRLFRLVRRSWHMFPLGLLFGLGFETATEVGLLGISATAASHGQSAWSILVFPALFSAGMALVDTADGILMLGAYGWAFMKPIRKLYYNVTITFVSVTVALVVGGIEVLGLLVDQLGLEGGVWEMIGGLNENFGLIGYLIIGIFVVSWVLSFLVYRWRGYDRIEVKV